MSASLARTATIALLCAATLDGCLTQHIRPPPSPAVLQARAAMGVKASPCAIGGLDAISPVEVVFAFDTPVMDESGHRRLATAAKWLSCNPGVPVVILPQGDFHGDAAHLNDLAQRRAAVVVAELNTLGAQAVTHALSRGAADPVTGPHLVVKAEGRGW